MKTLEFLCCGTMLLCGGMTFVPQQQNSSQLVLRTALDSKHHEIFASAVIFSDTGHGFDPGTYITFNGMPIVDTRPGNSGRMGTVRNGAFVSPQDGTFEWSYEGPDTNFEVEIPAQTQPVIADSMNGKTIYLADSLQFGYVPAGSCWNLQLVLADEFQENIRPTTQFDATHGALLPTWIGSIGLESGAGTLAIARTDLIYFSSPRFGWVIVEDSVQSEPVNVIWQ